MQYLRQWCLLNLSLTAGIHLRHWWLHLLAIDLQPTLFHQLFCRMRKHLLLMHRLLDWRAHLLHVSQFSFDEGLLDSQLLRDLLSLVRVILGLWLSCELFELLSTFLLHLLFLLAWPNSNVVSFTFWLILKIVDVLSRYVAIKHALDVSRPFHYWMGDVESSCRTMFFIIIHSLVALIVNTLTERRLAYWSIFEVIHGGRSRLLPVLTIVRFQRTVQSAGLSDLIKIVRRLLTLSSAEFEDHLVLCFHLFLLLIHPQGLPDWEFGGSLSELFLIL